METIEERAVRILHQETAIDLWNASEVKDLLIKIATEQQAIAIERIDEFLEEHWDMYFTRRSDMKALKGWLKKVITEG